MTSADLSLRFAHVDFGIHGGFGGSRTVIPDPVVGNSFSKAVDKHLSRCPCKKFAYHLIIIRSSPIITVEKFPSCFLNVKTTVSIVESSLDDVIQQQEIQVGRVMSKVSVVELTL